MSRESVKYRKPEPTSVQGICVKCQIEKQSHKGYGLFRALCNACHKERFPAMSEYLNNYMKERRKNEEFIVNEYNKRQKIGYKKYKKDLCEHCGFKALHSCQLDVDHIDGNKSNNDPSNYQTLCSNCHRLKTYIQRNFKKAKPESTQAKIPIDPKLLSMFDKK